MNDVKSKCLKTTQHIADKILLLRRAKRFSQEKFAEFVGLDTRTVTRAENGRHRPSPETLEMIASAYQVPVSYFYDETVYDMKASEFVKDMELLLANGASIIGGCCGSTP